MSIRSAVHVTLVITFVAAAYVAVPLAHEILGVSSYYACRSGQARAFLRSPNPGAANQDYPLEVLDAAGNPTGEHIVVMTVENASELDARITAIGFAWEGAGGFELVELARTYNQLTTNIGGVRRGTIGLLDYTVAPSFTLPQSPGVTFSIRPDIHGVPGFPHTILNFALVTDSSFAGGNPTDGLPMSTVRHVIAFKGVLPTGVGGVPHIETLLNDAYVRFRRVGVDFEGAETGIWRNLLPAVICP